MVSLGPGSAVISDAGCTLASSRGPSASSAWSGASKSVELSGFGTGTAGWFSGDTKTVDTKTRNRFLFVSLCCFLNWSFLFTFFCWYFF